MESTNRQPNRPRSVRRGFASRLLIGLASAVSILLFQNCGTDFVPSSDADLASFGIFACGGSLKDAYVRSYWPGVRKTCAGCHSSVQAPYFAREDGSLAYDEFLKTSQSKLSEYAQNEAHGSGAGGPENSAWVAKAESDFNSCKGGGGGSTGATARTTPIVMNANATLALRSLANLDSSLELGATNLGGATLHFQVKVESVGSMPVYSITRPSLQTGSATVLVKRIMIRINGQVMSTATTFSTIDRVINPNTNPLAGQVPNGNLSTATALIEYPGANPATDTVQFEFDLLQAQ